MSKSYDGFDRATISQAARRLRLAAGMSHNDVAQAVGCSRSTISNFEGVDPLAEEKIRKLPAVFGFGSGEGALARMVEVAKALPEMDITRRRLRHVKIDYTYDTLFSIRGYIVREANRIKAAPEERDAALEMAQDFLTARVLTPLAIRNKIEELDSAVDDKDFRGISAVATALFIHGLEQLLTKMQTPEMRER